MIRRALLLLLCGVLSAPGAPRRGGGAPLGHSGSVEQARVGGAAGSVEQAPGGETRSEGRAPGGGAAGSGAAGTGGQAPGGGAAGSGAAASGAAASGAAGAVEQSPDGVAVESGAAGTGTAGAVRQAPGGGAAGAGTAASGGQAPGGGAAGLVPDTAGLGAELARIEMGSGGVLGMAALDLDSGVALGWRAQERFPMMSVYKLPIAIRALALMEAGALPYRKWFKLEPSDYSTGHSPLRDEFPEGVVRTAGQLLELMVRDSDNSACDFLLGKVGGPKAVDFLMNRLTEGGIRVDRTEREISADFQRMGPGGLVEDGRDSATPQAMTRLLVLLERRLLLQPRTTETLIRWMTETRTGANRIKALLPAGVRVWHKTGSGGAQDGITLCTNDVGVMAPPGGAGRIALAVFVKLSTRDSAAQERAIAETALAVYRYFRGAPPR